MKWEIETEYRNRSTDVARGHLNSDDNSIDECVDFFREDLEHAIKSKIKVIVTWTINPTEATE